MEENIAAAENLAGEDRREDASLATVPPKTLDELDKERTYQQNIDKINGIRQERIRGRREILTPDPSDGEGADKVRRRLADAMFPEEDDPRDWDRLFKSMDALEREQNERKAKFQYALKRALTEDRTKWSDIQAGAFYQVLVENDPVLRLENDPDGKKLFGEEARDGKQNLERLLDYYAGRDKNALANRELKEFLEIPENERAAYAREKMGTLHDKAVGLFNNDEQAIEAYTERLSRKQPGLYLPRLWRGMSPQTRKIVNAAIDAKEFPQGIFNTIPDDEKEFALAAYSLAKGYSDTHNFLTQGAVAAWDQTKDMIGGALREVDRGIDRVLPWKPERSEAERKRDDERELWRLKLENATRREFDREDLTWAGEIASGVLGTMPFMLAYSNPWTASVATAGMMNDAYERMRLGGVGHDMALALSVPIGLAEGFIEKLQWEGIFGHSISEYALREASVAAIGKAAVKGAWREAGKKGLLATKEGLFTYATETAEEILQDMAESLGVAIGRGEFDLREFAQSAIDTAFESSPATAGFGVMRATGAGPAIRAKLSRKAKIAQDSQGFLDWLKARDDALMAIDEMKHGASADATGGESEKTAVREELLDDLRRKWRKAAGGKGLQALLNAGATPEVAAHLDGFFKMEKEYENVTDFMKPGDFYINKEDDQRGFVSLAELLKNIPGVKNAVQNEDGTMDVDFALDADNSVNIRFETAARRDIADIANPRYRQEVAAIYDKAHGAGEFGKLGKPAQDAVLRAHAANASIRITAGDASIPYDAVVKIAKMQIVRKDGKAWMTDKGADAKEITHEIWHAATMLAKEYGIVSQEELARLADVFGKAQEGDTLGHDEEAAADRFGEFIRGKLPLNEEQGGIVQRIIDFFKRIFGRVEEAKTAMDKAAWAGADNALTAENIFNAVASGNTAAIKNIVASATPAADEAGQATQEQSAGEAEAESPGANADLAAKVAAALNTDNTKREVQKGGTEVDFGETPQELTAIGIPKGRIYTKAHILRKLNKKHALTPEDVVAIVQAATKPVAVLRDKDGYVIITPHQSRDANGRLAHTMVYLRPDGKGNFVASAYARTVNGEQHYRNLVDNGGLLYGDVKRVLRQKAEGEEKTSLETSNPQNSVENLAQTAGDVKGINPAHVKNLAENTGEVFTDGKNTVELLGFDGNGQYRIRANGTDERIADIEKIQIVFAPGGKWRRLEGKEKRDHLQKSAEARFPGFKYTNNFDVVKATGIAAWGGADPAEGGDQMLADLLQIVRDHGHLLPKPRHWNDWRRAVGQWRRHGHRQVPGASAPNSKFPTFADYHVTGDGEILDALLAIADDKNAINLIFGTGKGIRHGSPDEADLTGNLPEYFHPMIEKVGAAGFVQYYLDAVEKYRAWAEHQRRMLTDPEYYGAAMAERYGENWRDAFNANGAEVPQNAAEDYAAAGAGADATDFNVDELESDLEQRDADYYSNDYYPDPFDFFPDPEAGSGDFTQFSVSVKDMEEARIQYNAVVRRYTNADGTKKPGWMKAPNGKPTNLTERQWVQTRTPNFKRWFGDWEAAANAVLRTEAKTYAEGRAALAGLVGKKLESADGLEATISNNSIDKIFSGKALYKSVSKDAHLAAAANLEQLYAAAQELESEPGRKANVKTMHRLYTPFVFDGDVFAAKISVKEFSDGTENRLYTVEAIDVEKVTNAGILAPEQSAANGEKESPSANVKRNLAQLIENVNNVSKIVDENGEPLVVWHGGRENNDFTTFDPKRIQTKDGVRGFYFAPPKRRDSLAGYYGRGEERAFYLNIRNALAIAPDAKPGAEELKAHDGIVRTAQVDYPARKFYNWRTDALETERVANGDIVEIVAFSPDQIKSATDNTGAFGIGERDIRYSIAGLRGAEAMGIGNNADALEMERRGASREEIWRATGWWRGKDGKWRVELPDATRSKFKGNLQERHFYDYTVFRLGELVSGEALENAYPEIFSDGFDMIIVHVKDETGFSASYSPELKTIEIPRNMLIVGKYADGTDWAHLSANGLPMIVHEIQHAIQKREGFATGEDGFKVDYDTYHRTAGEVEARNTERRLTMTAEERAAIPPWETEDVPEDRQIVRFSVAVKENEKRPPSSNRYDAEADNAGRATGGRQPIALAPERAASVRGFAASIAQNGVKSPLKFLQGLFNALGSDETNPDKTQYFDIVHPEKGAIVLRVANHRANADTFVDNGEDGENLSLVVKMSEKRFRQNGEVRLTEFVYFPDRLTAERQEGIARAVASLIEGGEVEFPEADQTNRSPHDTRFSISGLYTGSAADYANKDEKGNIINPPSLHHIGTGEGAQVYGWGLYASNQRGVAENYAEEDRNTKEFLRSFVSRHGRKIDLFDSSNSAEVMAAHEVARTKGDIRRATRETADLIKRLKEGVRVGALPKAATQDLKRQESVLRMLKEGGWDFRSGQASAIIYEQTFFTNRPEGDESHLLKWYGQVTKKQKEWIKAQAEKEGLDVSNLIRDGGISGEDVYDFIVDALGSPKAASEFLARAGIDGVKYPVNSFNRNVKDGDEAGWNYVSFRDDNIRVDHKWTDGEKRYSISEPSGEVDEATRQYPVSAAQLAENIEKLIDGGNMDLRFKGGEREKAITAAREFHAKYADMRLPISTGGYMFFAPSEESVARHGGDAAAAWAEYALHAVTNGNRDKDGKHYRAYNAAKVNEVNPRIAEIVAEDKAVVLDEAHVAYYKQLDNGHLIRIVARAEGRDLRVSNFAEVTGVISGKKEVPATAMSLRRAVEAWLADGKSSQNSTTDNDNLSQTAAEVKGEERQSVSEAKLDPELLAQSVVASYVAVGKPLEEGQVAEMLRAIGADEKRAKATLAEGTRLAKDMEDVPLMAQGIADAVSDRRYFDAAYRRARGRKIAQLAEQAYLSGVVKGKGLAQQARDLAEAKKQLERAQIDAAHGFTAAAMESKYGFDLVKTAVYSIYKELERLHKLDDGDGDAAPGETNGPGKPITGREEEAEETPPPVTVPHSPAIDAITEDAKKRADEIDKRLGLSGGESPRDKAVNERRRELNKEIDVANAKAQEGGEGEEENGEGRKKASEEAESAEAGRGAKEERQGLDFTRASEFVATVEKLVEKELRERNAVKDGAEPFADAVNLRELTNTARHWLTRIAGAMVYSQARELAQADIDRLLKATSLEAFEVAAMNAYNTIQRNLIRQTQAKIVKDLIKKGDEIARQGRQFAYRQDERKRKVHGEKEKWWRAIRNYFLMGEDAVEAEAARLKEIMDKRIRVMDGDGDYDIETDRDWRSANDLLAALTQYGGLVRRMPGEIERIGADVLHALETSRDELVNEREETRIQNGIAASVIRQGLANPKAEKGNRQPEPGRIASFFDSMIGILHVRLRNLVIYAEGETRRRAEDELRNIEDALSIASETASVSRLREEEKFRKVLEGIYGSAAKGMRRLTETLPEEVRRRLSKQGVKEITRAWLLQRYAELLQSDYQSNIIVNKRDGEWRVAFDEAMSRYITAQDLQVMAWIRNWYRGNLQELNSRLIVPITGVRQYSPGENYYPVKMKTAEREGFDPAARAWSPIPAWLTPRVKNSLDFDETTDIVTMWHSRMADGCQQIAYAKLGLNLAEILFNPETKKAIIKNHGKQALTRLREQVRDVLAGRAQEAINSDDSLAAIDMLRAWQTNISLSFNPLTAIKQTLSMPVFALRADIPLSMVARHLVDVSPAAVRDLMSSDFFKARYGEGISEVLRNAKAFNTKAGGIGAIVGALFNAGFKINEIGDAVPGIWIGQGLYRAFVAKIRDTENGRRMSDEEIKRLALARTGAIIEQTQQSSRLENLNALQRGAAGWGRLVYQFASAPVQQAAFEINAFREWKAAKGTSRQTETRRRLLRVLLINHVIIPFLFQAAGAAFNAFLIGSVPDPEEWRNRLLGEMIVGPLASMVFVGSMAKDAIAAFISGKRTFGNSALPVESMSDILEIGGKTLHDLMAIKTEDLQKDIVDMASKISAPTRLAVKIHKNRSDRDTRRRNSRNSQGWRQGKFLPFVD